MEAFTGGFAELELCFGGRGDGVGEVKGRAEGKGLTFI